MIDTYIKKLVDYAVATTLVDPEDRIYVTNRILEVLHRETYEEPAEAANAGRSASETENVERNASETDHVHAAETESVKAAGTGISDIEEKGMNGTAPSGSESSRQNREAAGTELETILKELLDYAAGAGLLEHDSTVYRDLFDTKLMGCLTPPPSVVTKRFFDIYQTDREKATDFFYKFCQDSDYIRRYRIKKDIRWSVESEYGPIDISINLSKPEKDPKAIAAAKNAAPGGYPKCLLCKENAGYAGSVTHPARQNHRTIPLTINGTGWGFQYSPYVYYNEHCIVFNNEHIPMKIERATFVKLFDFIKLFPHYFLGSNADLPIVGGSILSHDHYQGGRYTFAMERAPITWHFTVPGYEDVEAGIVKWPLSVIRIRHKDERRLIDLAEHILDTWRGYTDADAAVYASTGGERHNTITPIARKSGECFELDLALRNNLTTKEYPLGLYHPHAQYHHIKKENIGLIEVMGLAILPSRLKEEMELLSSYILSGRDIRSNAAIKKHADWVDAFLPNYTAITDDNISDILKTEIGKVFVGVLEDAGVYKCTKEGRTAFKRFIAAL